MLESESLNYLKNIIVSQIEANASGDAIDIIQWAEKYRFFYESLSGRFFKREDSWIFLDILNDLLDDDVKVLSCEKSAQIGASSNIIVSSICFFLDVFESKILYITKNDKLAKAFMSKYIDPMIFETPSLANKLGYHTKEAFSKSVKNKSTGSTQSSKVIGHGEITVVGANAIADVITFPYDFIFFDEVDTYKEDIAKFGDFIQKAKSRMITSKKGKMILLSTPSIEGESLIDEYFRDGTMSEFHIPCPHCGFYQVLEFSPETFKFERDNDKNLIEGSSSFLCVECNKKIEEKEKDDFLSKGRYIAKKTNKSHKSYRLSPFVSKLSSWDSVSREFLTSKNSQTKLQVFYNDRLGIPFKYSSANISIKKLLNQNVNPTYTRSQIPNEVAFMTLGVDVQEYYIQAELVGFKKNDERFSIDYFVLDATSDDLYKALTNDSDRIEFKENYRTNTPRTRPWQRLEEIIKKEYYRKDKTKCELIMTFVDSGYNPTTNTYPFVDSLKKLNVFSIKGQRNLDNGRTAFKETSVDKSQKNLIHINKFLYTNEVLNPLEIRRNPSDKYYPSGWSHFPVGYDEEYFLQLTAEILVQQVNNKGVTEVFFQKIRTRNEALDTHAYALAAKDYALLLLSKKMGFSKVLKESKERIFKYYLEKRKKELTN